MTDSVMRGITAVPFCHFSISEWPLHGHFISICQMGIVHYTSLVAVKLAYNKWVYDKTQKNAILE